jgi:SpoVK/Ycf46/Vps4 family AAA+-type ATPase
MNVNKGSGKTVCAKILANKMELPVIIIKTWGEANQSMIEYLGSFNFDCVLFFDEFEKQFEEKDSTVLQIMDGVYNNTESRKIFLLTTN